MAQQGADPADGRRSGNTTHLRRSELVALATSYLVGGISVSLVVANAGTPEWLVVVAAVVMYSATGELALVSVLAAGGSPVTGVVSGLLVSARFGILAVSLSARLRTVASVPERVLAAFCVVDPTVAVAMRESADRDARRTYWRTSIWMGGGWVLGTLLGVVIGSVIPDPSAWGLDAVIPASLIAILGTPLRTRDGAVAAVGAAIVALVLTPFVPAGLPVLLAVVAAVAALAVPMRPAAATATPAPSVPPSPPAEGSS